MNVANLQMQGLLMAMASINRTLVAKGLLSVDEIDRALRTAEATLTGEARMVDDLPPANRDAVCFPVRLLIAANRDHAGGGTVASFTDLSRSVGLHKEPYGDQL